MRAMEVSAQRESVPVGTSKPIKINGPDAMAPGPRSALSSRSYCVFPWAESAGAVSFSGLLAVSAACPVLSLAFGSVAFAGAAAFSVVAGFAAAAFLFMADIPLPAAGSLAFAAGAAGAFANAVDRGTIFTDLRVVHSSGFDCSRPIMGFGPTGVVAISFSTDIPSITWPNAVYLPSRNGAGPCMRKNWEPAEFGVPLFAIEITPGRCLWE